MGLSFATSRVSVVIVKGDIGTDFSQEFDLFIRTSRGDHSEAVAFRQSSNQLDDDGSVSSARDVLV